MMKVRTIAKNSAFLYLRMLVVLGTSLYTVRAVLQALGVDDFGIYGVAGGLVAIFAFLNATMTRAAQRFLGIDIGVGDETILNRTFNAILLVNVAIAVFVVFLSLSLGYWLLNNKLNIPVDRLAVANIVLLYSVATIVAMIIRTPFNALIISREKIWFFSATSIIEALLKLSVAFLISQTTHDRLTFYALLMCVVSWLMLFVYVAFCRVNFKESKLVICREREPYAALFAFTSWSFIGNLSHVFRAQGINMLLNVFFGTSLNAVHGVMTQAQGAATQLANSFELALSPQIYQSYGRGDLKSVQSLVFIGAKLNFMLLAVLVAPAIYGMDYLLHFWLGVSLDYLADFVRWMLLAQLLETVSHPLMIAAFATGDIKRYQLVVGGTILLNLPLSWLAFELGSGPMAFLYVAFGIQLLAFALRVWFLKNMINLHVPAFFRAVIIPLLSISIVGVLAVYGAVYCFGYPQSFFDLIKGGMTIFFSLCLTCFFLGLNSQERNFLLSRVLKKIRK